MNIIAFNIFTFGAGFFLCMLCCLLIEGIEFLLRDSLLHVPFFVLQIKNEQSRCLALRLGGGIWNSLGSDRSDAIHGSCSYPYSPVAIHPPSVSNPTTLPSGLLPRQPSPARPVRAAGHPLPCFWAARRPVLLADLIGASPLRLHQPLLRSATGLTDA